MCVCVCVCVEGGGGVVPVLHEQVRDDVKKKTSKVLEEKGLRSTLPCAWVGYDK